MQQQRESYRRPHKTAANRDFALLGISSVAELARREPDALYRELCRKMRKQQDACVLDTFRAAVEQAPRPELAAREVRLVVLEPDAEDFWCKRSEQMNRGSDTHA